MVDRVEIGRVGKPHGLRGEVVVTAITNRPERFEPGCVFETSQAQLTVASARPHKNAWLVQFEEIQTIDEAEALRGESLWAEPLGDLPEGEYWVHELIGCEVVDQKAGSLGKVEVIENNPASDLLVLESGVRIPMVFVTGQQDGTVMVDLPDGLLEL